LCFVLGKSRCEESEDAAVNLNTGWTELNTALKTLREQWEEVKLHWQDAVSQEFEENFCNPLEDQVRATLRGIERLSPALVQMQNECGQGEQIL
jgi:hypothetical protein